MDHNRETKKKKGTPFVPMIVAALVIMSAGMDADIMFGLLVLLIPLGIFVVAAYNIGRALQKKSATQHSHDRIDHSSDLQVDPQTGRVLQKPTKTGAHSAREHWKQQLDGLLANGTIDRAEYRALMNRRF